MGGPVAALAQLGGAARCARLRALGVGQRALARAVAEGRIARLAPGLYALEGCSRAAVAAAAVGGALSCYDALEQHGVSVVARDRRAHVLAPRGSQRTWPDTEVHRAGLPAGGRLGLVEALAGLARCTPTAVVVSAVDSALRDRRCRWDDLLAARPSRDASWRRVLALADARAMSDLESLARVELVEALAGTGVLVEPQVVLDGIGAVDLLVDGWVIAETDGFTFHADRASYRRDRHRDAVAAAHGYAHLRFTFETVLRRDGSVALVVQQVLQRGRPPFWHSLRRERRISTLKPPVTHRAQ